MSIFSEVKQQVKPKQLTRFYLGKPIKSGTTDYYLSPFRNEKTPSFAVHDKRGLTDFGSGEHYDIVSFVQKLYRITPIEAAKKIASDFHLNIDINPFDESNKISVYRVKGGLKKWRDETLDCLTAIYKETQTSKRTLKPDTIGYFVACELEGPLDYWTDALISGSETEWLQVFRELGWGWCF